jgi:uncharacterized membrane protein
MKKQRIWELDALRGVAMLGVVIVHFCFDLVYFLGVSPNFPTLGVLIQEYGGTIFVILSGVCVTLGKHSVKRGAIVFGFGMLITLATFGMYKLGLAESDIIIRYGVLHLLGTCMLLYPLYKKLPTGAMAALGAILVILGYTVTNTAVQARWLFPLGFMYPGFSSADYFPLLPHLGWYMLGTVLGRTVYRNKTSLLPKVPQNNAVVRFFCFCGRQSLWIYLAHQPVLYGIVELIVRLQK